MRKVVQIAFDSGDRLHALCDDGKMFCYVAGETGWIGIEAIPQDAPPVREKPPQVTAWAPDDLGPLFAVDIARGRAVAVNDGDTFRKMVRDGLIMVEAPTAEKAKVGALHGRRREFFARDGLRYECLTTKPAF